MSHEWLWGSRCEKGSAWGCVWGGGWGCCLCVGVGVLLVGGAASGLHGLSLVLDGGAETVYG